MDTVVLVAKYIIAMIVGGFQNDVVATFATVAAIVISAVVFSELVSRSVAKRQKKKLA
ncbi:hypothetical protein RYA05_03075 [Pseudomonas syringae pv. actinidiae]|nr:hypothetical protein [Pseudomonas syringae pv. actinidiae]